jgi:DNA-binding transcriptional ArsR family regulator
MKLNTEQQKDVALLAKALSNPIRVQILYFLAAQQTCYFGEIFEDLPICKATVSQHLTELKRAKLIQGSIEGPKTKYCINLERWKEAKILFQNLFADCHPQKECCSNPE